MNAPTAHRSALHALALRADHLRWDDLWAALTKAQREEALRVFLAVDDRPKSRQLVAQSIVAGARGYSLAKLLRQSPRELARIGGTLRSLIPTLSHGVLTTWLIEEHGSLQRCFFEATGNGALCDERGTATTEDFGTGDTAVTKHGCDAVLAADPELGLIYLLALCLASPDRWSGIQKLMMQWAAGTAPPDEMPTDVAVSPDKESPPVVHVSPDVMSPPTAGGLRLQTVPEPQLTILDDLLTRTILSAWGGAEHSLSRPELFALLEEVVYTNTERRRSNFHLGFADALFDEPWRSDLRARSEERRAWYAAGYLVGVARRAGSEQMAACFEAHDDARLLAAHEWPPLRTVASTLVRALVDAKRLDALARLAPVVTRLSDDALKIVGEQGRLALERRDAGMARALLEPAVERMTVVLANMPDTAPARVRAPFDRLHHDLRRRLAHAFRLTGAADSARSLLEGLLVTEPDVMVRGMILTDLALLGAGLRELAELTVPDDGARHEELAALFTPVAHLIRDAMPASGPPSAHAAYTTGVLALLRRDWMNASANLRLALDAFEARPSNYTGRGLLKNARLYTAIAELLDLRREEVARLAGERLCDMVLAGGRPPRCLLEELVSNALLVDASVGESLMQALLDRQILSLDAIASFGGATEHAQVATAMTTAALEERRPLTARVELAYRALPVMVRIQHLEHVEALLGVLEDGAAEGIAVDRYVQLLEHQRERWELCWDRVDAKWSAIRVHLCNGQLEQARECVVAAFFAVMGNAQHRHDWMGEAEDLLDALRQSGATDVELAALVGHLPADRVANVAPTFRPNARHTILVVGGNEEQRRFVDALAASLREEFGEAIQVMCYQTGMTSTWNRQLEKVERLLPKADGVVISRFIRTTFGRNLRRQLGARPWRTCGSAGMGRVRALVVELAGELERLAAG